MYAKSNGSKCNIESYNLCPKQSFNISSIPVKISGFINKKELKTVKKPHLSTTDIG